jgi:hypothetical protein
MVYTTILLQEKVYTPAKPRLSMLCVNVPGKIFSLLLPIFCCISANTCDDMGRTATINKNALAAIEITITTIVKPFCLINIKLIIINLLIKKAFIS